MGLQEKGKERELGLVCKILNFYIKKNSAIGSVKCVQNSDM